MLDELIPAGDTHASVDTDDALNDPMHSMWNDSSDTSTGLFGLPFSVEQASVVIVPAPWDAACSQGLGTAQAPQLILDSSRYVELHDVVLGNIYERGIAMAPLTPAFDQLNETAQQQQSSVEKLDMLSEQMGNLIYQEVSQQLAAGKSVGLIGGDHSVSLGAIAAHKALYPDIGVLQIDAHADLRPSLDGLQRSHASVIYHVMNTVQPHSLTQVGIRAICSVEKACQQADNRITQFTDHELQTRLAEGQVWLSLCDQIIESLPKNIYLTLDIDALQPTWCPNTGTPVPGGLSYTQLTQLLHRIQESDRTVCGFDLVEVGGHEQDALIAAHLLYTLCGLVK